jgi:MFS family permease
MLGGLRRRLGAPIVPAAIEGDASATLSTMTVERLIGPIRDVLRNPAMVRLQASWFLGIGAEWAYVVALLVWAYGFGGVAAAGLITTVRMLPPILGAPIASAVADRLPPNLVLAAVNVVRAAVVAASAAVIVLDASPLFVFGAAMLEGLLAVLKRPATLSMLPALARSPEELVAGNAVTSTGEALGVLLGPAVTSVLLAFGSVELALGAPAIALLIASVLLLTIRAARPRPAGPGRGPLRELGGGFAALRRHPSAGLVIGLLSAQTLVRGLLTVLLVAASAELLGLGEGGVGWLTAAMGAGGLVGAASATVWMAGGRLGPMFSLSLAAWGLPIALVGVFPVVWLAVVLMAVVGLANASLDVAGFTLIQRSVPNALRARVFGAMEGIVALTFAVGSLAAAPLVELLGLTLALVVTGAILPILAIVSAAAVRRADLAAIVPRRELDLLRRDPLFAPLSLVVIEQLAHGMTVERGAAGTTLVAQGEVGDAYWLIGEGSADVVRDGRTLRRLGPGDGFGEIALIEDRPRTASVVATEAVVLHRLPRDEFLDAVGGTPASASAADRLVSERLAGLEG